MSAITLRQLVENDRVKSNLGTNDYFIIESSSHKTSGTYALKAQKLIDLINDSQSKITVSKYVSDIKNIINEDNFFGKNIYGKWNVMSLDKNLLYLHCPSLEISTNFFSNYLGAETEEINILDAFDNTPIWDISMLEIEQSSMYTLKSPFIVEGGRQDFLIKTQKPDQTSVIETQSFDMPGTGSFTDYNVYVFKNEDAPYTSTCFGTAPNLHIPINLSNLFTSLSISKPVLINSNIQPTNIGVKQWIESSVKQTNLNQDICLDILNYTMDAKTVLTHKGVFNYQVDLIFYIGGNI